MASEIVVLRNFFGMKPGQTLQEFGAELKALTADDKRELAELAAKELGVELDAPKPAAA